MKFNARRLLKPSLFVFAIFIVPVSGKLIAYYASGELGWRHFSRHESTRQAPDASSNDAVVQVYAARAARWRGALGVHTWIATKRSDEQHYMRLEVIGYHLRWSGDTVRVRRGVPDAMWFGNRPTLLRELRGNQQVDELIDRLHALAHAYPSNDTYHVWPGPNSNTFTAHLASQFPSLRLELPATAIGKDFLLDDKIVSKTPSGKGVQVSFNGYAGILLGLEEGIEINLMGLTAGIDIAPPAIKLPGIGRIGFDDVKRFTAY